MTGVSFIVTVYDKRAYLPRVIDALACQQGDFERQFIFVDDGSTDGSADTIAALTQGWRDQVVILRQENGGASAATNAGARRAAHPWLKLVDGDDLLAPHSTIALLEGATAMGESLAYGELGTYAITDPMPFAQAPRLPAAVRERDGLARFIRNCPCNSSTILVTAERYWRAGGCDERLVSPDQALFLRLFARGGAAYLPASVAYAPVEAPRRLSGQRRRSRYESVLALYYLVSETQGLAPRYKRLATRRALSRARRFHRAHGGALLSPHLWRYLASFLQMPVDPAPLIYRSLAAFTEDGSTERPSAWLPGALARRT
jgi:cellulose synthase/poly-beta-1,6-N-acetylglucosamine synthase-like glycosyltransferase